MFTIGFQTASQKFGIALNFAPGQPVAISLKAPFLVVDPATGEVYAGPDNASDLPSQAPSQPHVPFPEHIRPNTVRFQ